MWPRLGPALPRGWHLCHAFGYQVSQYSIVRMCVCGYAVQPLSVPGARAQAAGFRNLKSIGSGRLVCQAQPTQQHTGTVAAMACSSYRCGLACSAMSSSAAHRHAGNLFAPCGLSLAAGTSGQPRHSQLRYRGFASLTAANSNCRGTARRLVPTAATTPLAASAAEASGRGQGINVLIDAASSVAVRTQSAGSSVADVLAACKGSGGPIETLNQLLKLDEMLEKGYAPIWGSEERWRMFLEAFCALVEFEPHVPRYSPELGHAAAAARRSLLHGLAKGFVSSAPNAPQPFHLAAALMACAKVGYGWGGAGGAATAAGAEAEVPLAAVALKRLGELADDPSGLCDSPHCVPEYEYVWYNEWDTHVYLWEAMAAAPPAVAAAYGRLLDASAKVIVGRMLPGDIDTHFMLKALARLHPLMQDAGPLARFLIYELPLYEGYNSLTSEQLCAVVEVVGELLLNAPTVRRVLMPTVGHVSGVVGILVYEAQSEVEKMLWWSADADAAGWWWPEDPEPYVRTPNVLRLLRGFAMISEACSASSNSGSSSCSTSSSCSSTTRDSGGGSDGGNGSDSDLFGIDPAPDVALQAAAAAQDIASKLEGQAFSLSPQDLSSLAVSLARLRYGTDRCYRNLVSAATSRSTFRSAATLAHWAQLWHALALVRHRPDDALVRCTAAAMTKQQQDGCATAADCSTLLLSLAELRCYDGGLVEGLLGRLVQLVAGGGGVEVRDLTNAVWAVAVMGPDALRAHCGAVGQLLREVVAVWEQGWLGAGVGEQELLQVLWQVQLELEGLVDGGAGSSGGISSGSSPGQLRNVLPPDLLRAAEAAAAREGPLGAHSSYRLLQRMRDEVCSVLRGMVQQGGEQQEGQGAQRQQGVGVNVAAGPVPACMILAVTPEAAVPELRCTADVVVELGRGRRVAVEVEGPGRLLTNHPHTETRTGPAELRRRQLERVLGSGNVLGVSYWAWEELVGDRGRQESWLCGLLAEGLGAGAEVYGEVKGK